jgi:DNA-directed RNA polymerase subunit RPC12/RpoP
MKHIHRWLLLAPQAQTLGYCRGCGSWRLFKPKDPNEIIFPASMYWRRAAKEAT